MLELLARRRLGDAEGEAARRQQMRIGEGLLRRVGRRHAHRERLAARQLAGGRELEVREARPLHLLAEGDGDVDLALVAGEAAAHLVVVRAVKGDVARKAVLAEDARREARGSVPDKAGGLKREDLERRLGRRDDERVVVVFAAEARLVRDRHAVGPGRLEGEGAGGVALRLGDAALVEHELLDDRQVVAADVLLDEEAAGRVVPRREKRRNGKRQVAHRPVELQDAVERRAFAARVELEVPRAGFLDRERVAVDAAGDVD